MGKHDFDEFPKKSPNSGKRVNKKGRPDTCLTLLQLFGDFLLEIRQHRDFLIFSPAPPGAGLVSESNEFT